MIQMRLEGCGGKVGPWVEEGLLLLASRDVGVQMRVGYQFKYSRSKGCAGKMEVGQHGGVKSSRVCKKRR